MKVLLAVDGSEYSVRAASYLATHLSLFREAPEILLLTVHPPIASPRVRAYVGKEALESYYAEESTEAIKPAGAVLTQAGLAFTTLLRVGEIGPTIAGCAAEQHCDLIVMGSHGHGAMGNLVLGSVATKVLAESKIPVLVVK